MTQFLSTSSILKKIQKVFTDLEDSSTPLSLVLATFLAIITLRNIFEGYATSIGIAPYSFVHFSLFYIALALSIITLFYLTTKEQVTKLIRVILPSFTILLLPPLIDLIVSKGNRYQMSYLLPEFHENILFRYFTFYSEFNSGKIKTMGIGPAGITPGIRIEIALALIASSFYMLFKTRSKIRTFIGIVTLYSIIFTFCAFPFITASLAALIPSFSKYSEHIFIQIYTLISLVLCAILSYYAAPNITLALLRDIRPLRLIHYLGFFIFGILLGISTTNKATILGCTLLTFAIALAWIFSVMTNNFADIAIDHISNPERPLIAGSIDPTLYQRIYWIIFILILITSWVISAHSMYLILGFTAVYFVYSMPPLRLKRVPILSKLAIGINTLLMAVLGFTYVTGSLIHAFPQKIGWFILISFSLAGNLIDIKDYEGDKAAKIMTLPTILGLPRAKLIISFLVAATYAWAYILINKPLFAPICTSFALLEFYLINKNNYRDKEAIGAYILSIIVIGLLLTIR